MNVVVLDVETTGKERATDQVIEICLRLGMSAEAESRTWRTRPTVAIHPEATTVHGIRAEDLAECPAFAVASAEFRPLLEAADVIVGYNVAFDVDMIQADFSRAGIPPLDLTRKRVVDVLRLWHHVEPRTLVAAHEKFCKEPLVDAHQATVDVAATARVLTSMLETFGLSSKDWPEIAAISDPFAGRALWLGPSPHVQWNERGAVVFGFGKHKGIEVDQVDGGFLRWILARDFPPHVKKICQVVLERRRQFKVWVNQYYPRPASVPAEALAVQPQASAPAVATPQTPTLSQQELTMKQLKQALASPPETEKEPEVSS